MELLCHNQAEDVLVVVGGIIPDVDIAKLKEIGVAAVFQPGTPMGDIVTFIREHVRQRHVSVEL